MENKSRSSFYQPTDPTSSPGSPRVNYSLDTPSLSVFSFNELKRATENFRQSAYLGEGAFGPVYRGHIGAEKASSPRSESKSMGCFETFKAIMQYQHHRRSGIHVAVKRCMFHGFEQWQNEVTFLGNLSHPNLIKLLGYCWEDKELLLVYEYMQNGSLDEHLCKERCRADSLSWERRMSIALGAARGLAFLHGLERPIIHRNLKASDILLDESFNAKISDFGLARFGPTDGNSHISTRIMGSSSIIAPEYLCTGHLYVKSDVFMFGVLLLEILTGSRAQSYSQDLNQRKQSTVQGAKPFLCDKTRLKTIMDERMEHRYPVEEAYKIAQLALRCLEMVPKTRPSMAEVVQILEDIN